MNRTGMPTTNETRPAVEWRDTAGAAKDVLVNGHHHPLPAERELMALLHAFDVTSDTAGVAVAVNCELVPRRAWVAYRLDAGDRIEIVRAVQGG